MMCWENAVSAEQLDRLPYLSNNQKKINKYAISKTKVIKRCTALRQFVLRSHQISSSEHRCWTELARPASSPSRACVWETRRRSRQTGRCWGTDERGRQVQTRRRWIRTGARRSRTRHHTALSSRCTACSVETRSAATFSHTYSRTS